MAKKKQPEEERRPDLAIPDQDILEARVHEMLDIEVSDAPKPDKVGATTPTKVEIKSDEVIETVPEKKEVEAQEVATAPELPGEQSDTTTDKPEPSEEIVPTEIDPEPTDEELEPKEKILNLDEALKDAAILEDPEPSEEDSEEPEVDDESEQKADENEQPVKESTLEQVIVDVRTSKAVDDIIAKESDTLLEVQDEKVAPAPNPDKKSLKQKILGFFKAWWNNPKARWATIIGVLLLLVAIFVIPTSRYFVLNAVGVRANVSVVVIDESTGQPLKNVDVTVMNATAKTDVNGTASLTSVKLGASDLTVKKRAFAESKKRVTVKTGDNAFSDMRLVPTGEQYSFVVTDFITKRPISKVEAISGDASALSDDQGKIKLTVDDVQDAESLDVILKKEDYREDKLSINPDDKSELPAVMVSGRQHMFISRRSGSYDLYSVYIDGKDEKKLLLGTGSERDDIAMTIHPTASVAAVVSTRSGKVNGDGFLVSTLTTADAQSKKIEEVTTSERIQLIGWIGDDLIYVQATAGVSAGNPKRHKLVSYNFKTKKNTELATSNYFNDAVIADNKIYYAPSGSFQPQDAKLYRMNADGSQKTTIVNQEIWNIFRSDYENLVLSANQTWLNVRIGEDKATSISTPPANPKSRTYVTSKDNKNSLWVDQRDGKGTLISYEVSSKNESTLKSENGLNYPTYWLDSRTIIYRVSSQQQTADYVMSLDGGEPYRIGDVTNTNSVDDWYYY